MMEKETQRSKETEAAQPSYYDIMYGLQERARQRALQGKVVIRGKEQPWQQARQGRFRYFLHLAMHDTAVQGWRFFVQDIRTHSGRHRHQGGLCIYVIEGKGWTTVDGVRHDWEEGDLILLPVKPRGCEHQHFNAEPGAPCKWLAFIYQPYVDALGNEMEQKEVSPDWAGQA